MRRELKRAFEGENLYSVHPVRRFAAVVALVLSVVAAGTWHLAYGWMIKKRPAEPAALSTTQLAFSQQDIPLLFEERLFYRRTIPPVFTKTLPKGEVTVFTTLQPRVQERLQALFQKYAPLIAAGVVLDAQSGAVLAMANYTNGSAGRELLPDGEENYCLYAGFPAASLIKIITAAAVLELKDFSPHQTLPVIGRYYTLYRSQLGLERCRVRGEPVPLEKAFALSINPFFGTLGISYLSDDEFARIARGFLFNTKIPFDLPVPESTVMKPRDDFERAEMASGYNTQTLISPLHAALIASLPVNEGVIMRPHLVERIVDAQGRVLYARTIEPLSRPLSNASVHDLRRLMQKTVDIGTARSAFAYLRARPDAQDWITGGKTGSIDLPQHRGRCDWFAGFGQEGATRVAVACILIHGAKRTVRSAYVASQAVVACLSDETSSFAATERHAVRTVKQAAVSREQKPGQKIAKRSQPETPKQKNSKTRKRHHKISDTATGG